MINVNETLFLTSILITLAGPLLSFIVSLFLIPRHHSWLSPIVSMGLLAIVTFASLFIYFNSPENISLEFSIPWFQIGQQNISLGILLDITSIRMVAVVSIVSLMIHIFSAGYMADDSAQKQYFAFLGLFTFGMLLLTVANNLFLLFIGWETVGVCSYLLIGHYRERPEAGKAAFQAFIINRLGDLGFIIAIALLWSAAGTLDFNQLRSVPLSENFRTLISLSLFWAVMAKSAQFPLFSWLPAAMEGPTPVSALIHAATMVVAGVFLMARMSWLFTPVSSDVFIIVGAITALLGAMAALSQYDIKKILAWSTISQLGFMVMAVGSQHTEASMMHLTTHAFFKAALFLGAGAIIHAMHIAQAKSGEHFDVQDIRNLGGLRLQLPVTFVVFVVASASLGGLPFTSGFASKEAILGGLISWSAGSSWKYGIAGVAFITSLITIFYIARLIHYSFFKNNSSNNSKPEEVPLIMRIPMIILAILSLWFVVSLNPINYGRWNVESHLSLTLFSSLWIVGGVLASVYYFRNQETLRPPMRILEHGFYLENLNERVGLFVLKLGTVTESVDRKVIDKLIHGLVYFQVGASFLLAWIDKIFIDGIPTGIAFISGKFGKLTRSFQGGHIQHYVFWSIFGLIIFLFFILK